MEKVKVIGLTSFSSIGISFHPGMETDIDKKQADEWIKAGLVKKANVDIEDAQLVEEPKVLTPEEIERNNLEAMAKQLGIVDGFDTLSNDELENNIQLVLTKKREEREAKLKDSQGQEAPQDENSKEKKPKPTKPRQVTDAGEKVE